jgi:hypothetical protein
MGADAWARMAQCRAVAPVQKISNRLNSIQIISISFDLDLIKTGPL